VRTLPKITLRRGSLMPKIHYLWPPALAASLLLLVTTGSSAAAEEMRQSTLVCITEAALDEAVSAAARKNMAHAEELIQAGLCGMAPPRTQYFMVDRGFLKSRIRVVSSGGSLVVWVVTETL
jgi:hypothetical protein